MRTLSRHGIAQSFVLMGSMALGLGSLSCGGDDPAQTTADASVHQDSSDGSGGYAHDGGEAGPQSAPRLADLGDQVTFVNQLLRFSLGALDADGDTLSFKGSNLPSGSTLDQNTGTFSWVPTASQVGKHDGVHFVVSDGVNEVSQDITIYVNPVGVDMFVLPAVRDQRTLPDSGAPTQNPSASIAVVGVPGQIEPASIVIRPTAALQGVTMQTSDLSCANGTIKASAVDIRVVKAWYQASGSSIGKSSSRVLVPELLLKNDGLIDVQGKDNYINLTTGERRLISEASDSHDHQKSLSVSDFAVRDADTLLPFDIKAHVNKQIWLTIRVPTSAKPGVYHGILSLKDTAGVVGWQKLAVEVLPAKIDPPSIEYSIYYTGIMKDDRPEGSISSTWKSEQQYRAEMQDIIDHGITNPSSYQSFYAKDLMTLQMKIRQEVGMTSHRFYMHYISTGSSSDASALASLKSKIAKAKAFLAPFGIDELYVYGVDEATGDNLAAEREAWKAVHDAGAKVFVAGYTGAKHPPGSFALMGDIQDMLVCAGAPDKEEAAKWHGAGHEIYNYANPQVGVELPETYRRNYGLLLWQNDYDGAMDFAYQYGFVNIWNDFDHYKYRDHNFTYPTVNGVIDTIQWEGFREGVDDMRYLTTLVNLIAARKKDQTKDVTAAEKFVASLKQTQLLNLYDIRKQLISFVLQLQPLSTQDMQAPIIYDVQAQNLDLSSGVDVPITWQTDERSDSYVTYGLTDSLGKSSPRDGRMVRSHVVTLTGLERNKTYAYRVHSSDGAGNETVGPMRHIDTTPAGHLLMVEPTPADGSTLKSSDVNLFFDVQSTFAGSLFVNQNDSLVARWAFDEDKGTTSKDRTGHAQDATLASGVSWVDGQFGRGISVEEASKGAACGDITVDVARGVSIEGWFKFAKLAEASDTNRHMTSLFYLHKSHNRIFLSGSNHYFKTTHLFDTSHWHHVVLTFKGNCDTAQLYVDGRRLSVHGGASSETIRPLTNFTIGGGSFEGLVDEVRVWNRVLSPEEVKLSYGVAPGRARLLVSGLAKGKHVFAARLIDRAGSEFASKTRNFAAP